MSVAHATPSQEEADIETSSEGYASRFQGALGAWLLKVQERAILKMIEGAGVKTVLDIGGGHGQLAGPLSDAGFQVTVAGSNPVCAARVNSLVAAGKCKFVAGDLLSLPFPDRSFDAVISVRFISHCDQWEKLIKEMTRLAGKQVVIDYPEIRQSGTLERVLFPLKKLAEGNTRAYRSFAQDELDVGFSMCGFESSERVKQFAIPMVVHRMVKTPKISGVMESIARGLGITDRIGSPVIAAYRRR